MGEASGRELATGCMLNDIYMPVALGVLYNAVTVAIRPAVHQMYGCVSDQWAIKLTSQLVPELTNATNIDIRCRAGRGALVHESPR